MLGNSQAGATSVQPSGSWLRQRVTEKHPFPVPGAGNALTARLIESLGFEAVYVTGAGIANWYLGTPDVGLVTLAELVDNVFAIRDAVALPIIVDADTGFGNYVGVRRTVRMLERAGADAIQIEDQEFPKRCGHFGGKSIVPKAEMRAKISSAADARTGETLLIARTDAVPIEGFQSAIDRAREYIAAGADMTFVEAPSTREQLLSIPRLLPVPQVANMVVGGRTPLLPDCQLDEFGFVLYANAALQAAIKGMRECLSLLADTRDIRDAVGTMASWDERQRLVKKHDYDHIEALFHPSI